MKRSKAFAWAVAATAGGVLVWLVLQDNQSPPPLGVFLFWAALLATVEFLPVSLGFRAEVTMSFPVHLALAIVFREQPWVAMSIAGLGMVDPREFRRAIAIHTAAFNRAQSMLSVAAAATVFSAASGDYLHPLVVAGAAVAHVVINLGSVAVYSAFDQSLSFSKVLHSLLPTPISGFFASYALLAALGTVTAVVDERVGTWAVAAILIPILFARLSFLGARAQQELSEKIRRQQEALLQATERVFQERERERKRIAEDIHDSSLQLLAAAAYGCGNARELLDAERSTDARQAVTASREAIEGAMVRLRESITALRKSSVEEGGLMDTIRGFADQASTLWSVQVSIEGEIVAEPPVPVALAAFQIFQEGLTNALKHSQTSAIAVRISEEDGKVHIVVQDEGTGFDPSEEVGEEHVGMKLMRERAARVGGELKLDSRPGEGTRLEAIFPAGVAQ
ncbi:MAG: sensor histidine kinase [Actinomycetota bacterium]